MFFERPRLLLLVGVERKHSDVLPDSPDAFVAVDGRICGGKESKKRREREVSQGRTEAEAFPRRKVVEGNRGKFGFGRKEKKKRTSSIELKLER